MPAECEGGICSPKKINRGHWKPQVALQLRAPLIISGRRQEASPRWSNLQASSRYFKRHGIVARVAVAPWLALDVEERDERV